MKLNLGCCDRHLPGFVNVDIRPPADQIADLEAPWPWPDNSAEEIVAEDVIEHLPDKIHTMNEAWRVLKAGGLFRIKVPSTAGPGAFQDPTHRSWWNEHSFLYYDPRRAEWQRFHGRAGVEAKFHVLSLDTRKHNNGVIDVVAVLGAVKP
jgi:ubiquinone/menaquinone biosynthesis C-methylase UbiE